MRLLGRLFSAAGVYTLLAGAVQACPVCILADPRTSGTYFKMTLVMSALPLALLGGLIYWLKQRYSPPRASLRPIPQRQSTAELVADHRI